MSFPPDPFKPGQILTAQMLNQIAQSVVSKITGGVGINIRVFGSQVVIEALGPDKANVSVFTRARVKIVRTDGNLLDCAKLNQSNDEVGTVVVARPPELQAVFYEGQSFAGESYTKTNADERESTGAGGPDETQLVTPDYTVDKSIVLIHRMTTGLVDPLNSNALVVWQAFTWRHWAPEA